MTINEAVLNPFSTNECSTSTPPENVRKPPVFSKSPNLLEKMVFYYHGTKIFGHFFSGTNTKKMKFSISFSRKLRIWSHLLKKFVMKNFIFCAVLVKPFVMLYVRWNEHRYITVESKNNYLENPRII